MKTLGAATAAAAFAGCAASGGRSAGRYDRPYSRQPFVAPRISRDRVVRVIVGHRPYRASGFVVRRDELDGKHVIHNYGHGSGGISLSWGSSALAVRETLGLPVGDAAVIGSGIMGLTSARLLQDAGWNVTIYTRDPTRHSVSNVGAGQWAPTGVFEEGVASKAFEAQYRFAARIAHHAYQNLVGAGYGVRFIENYYLDDDAPRDSYYLREMPELFTSVRDLEPGEHPFPTRYVKQTVTMLVQPAQFLRRVRNDFHLAGGRIVARNFGRVSEVLSLEENVIFNCTGLGAAALFGDEELQPAKGQLVFLPPDPAVDYLTVGGGSGVTYMFSRDGEIVLGGSFQRGDWSPHPEADVTERIIEDNRRVFERFG
ncbi:MAG: FAD-dependent oxidoreductase [Woeseiaceae bacterium]|nr:FAD-dependent oxidoreductase [Woeseiaceae bacterium]